MTLPAVVRNCPHTNSKVGRVEVQRVRVIGRTVGVSVLATWGVFALLLILPVLFGVFFEQNVVTRALDEILPSNPLARGAEILALLGVTAASFWALSQVPTGAGPDGFPKASRLLTHRTQTGPDGR